MISSADLVIAAHRTVDTFAKIVRRPLWLRNGETAKTNGREIIVPFADRDFYLLVERQISHILFRSDTKARKKFVEAFLERASAITKRVGAPEEGMTKIQNVVERVIDILESHRVESLWGMIYPGSYERSRERLQAEAAKLLPRANDSFFDLLVCLDAGLDVPSGDLDRFRPLFVEALRKVERRGFTATLVLARWLMVQLIDELLREDRGKPAQGRGKSAMTEQQGASARDDAVPDKRDNVSESSEESEAGATVRDRTLALHSLAQQFGSLPQTLETRYNDYNLSWKKTEDDFFLQPKSAAKEALSLDMNDAERVDNVLASSEQHMEALLNSIQRQLVQPIEYDSWLSKDAGCDLEFIDVTPNDYSRPASIETRAEDQAIVQRLRETFYRVMGRRSTALDEAGVEVDIPAYIERRITGQPLPCFRSPRSGRGFKAMILIDRSHSMQKQRIKQAERAAKILVEALDFPFVEIALWGFQSLEDGKVTITRFSPELEGFETDKSPVEGLTPLNIALQVAIRDMTEGSEAKQLFVLTDGAPLYRTASRRWIPEKQLRAFVREEVQTARQKGINVTALLIGDSDPSGKIRFDVSPKNLSLMFGPERYWKCVDEFRFGDDLVRAVADSFTAYLRSN